MITFERTNDAEIIRSVLYHPSINPWITDDFSPSREDFQPSEAEHIHHLIVKDGDEFLGLVIFVPWTKVLWEVHIPLLPSAWWGMKIRPAFAAALDWAWDNTACQRIVAHVPDSPHRAMLRFPPQFGMQKYGLSPKCIQRNGQLIDLHLFGISRPPAKKEPNDESP